MVQSNIPLYICTISQPIKRNETVPFTEMWMDLVIVIQDEVGQKEINKYSMISLICGI